MLIFEVRDTYDFFRNQLCKKTVIARVERWENPFFFDFFRFIRVCLLSCYPPSILIEGGITKKIGN